MDMTPHQFDDILMFVKNCQKGITKFGFVGFTVYLILWKGGHASLLTEA